MPVTMAHPSSRDSDRDHLTARLPASRITSFFGSYPDFRYDASKPSAEEYQRLRKLYGWKRGDADSSENDKAWTGFRQAMVKEFNRLFGTDPQDLLAWQTLCTVVGIGGSNDFATCEECVTVCF